MRCSMLMLVMMVLAGCRTFEIGLVQTPIPDLPTPIPTVSPLLLTTPTPAQSTATPLVYPTSTATMTSIATRRPTLRPTSIPMTRPPTSPPLPEGPSILSFTIEPLQVDPGDTVTLNWSVANADTVDIVQRVPDTLPSYNTVNLAATGQLTQTILDRERLWHAYELSALRDSRVVTQAITVSIRCPYTYFFSPLPAEDRADWSCPDGDPITSTAAEQVFENGRMLWLQHDDRIYVLFDDGTYQTFEDTWVAGQPDSVPGLTPPTGRYQPVRGFGKVWSGDADVRARLRWALAEERGFATQVQGGWLRCCSRLNAVNRPIYLHSFEGRIIRLWPGEMPFGQWKWVE